MQAFLDRILFEKRESEILLQSLEKHIGNAGFRQFIDENPIYGIDTENKLKLYREQWDTLPRKKSGVVSLSLQKFHEKTKAENKWITEFSTLIGFIEPKKTLEEWIESYGLKTNGKSTLLDIARENSVRIVLIHFLQNSTEYEAFGSEEYPTIILAINCEEFIGKLKPMSNVIWEEDEGDWD